jgi:hypothetical protein
MGALFMSAVELEEPPINPGFTSKAHVSSGELTWIELFENDVSEERLCGMQTFDLF